MKLPATLVLPLLVVLLSACSDQSASTPDRPAAKAPLLAPAPTSYASVLLSTGLVAPAHRSWVMFCDTTRQQAWQLGHSPPAVWEWLADYERRLAEGQSFNPAAPARRPTAYDKLSEHEKMGEPIIVPATAAEKRAVRTQTTQLVQQLRQASLLTPAQYRQLLPLAEAGEFANRRFLLESIQGLTTSAQELRQSQALAPSLQRLGLLAPAQARQLARDLHQGTLTDPLDVLGYLPQARAFNRRDYPAALPPYLLRLHQDVASLLPGLHFNDFQSQVLTPGELAPCINCPGQQDALVSLRLNGRRYAQRNELVPDMEQVGNPLRSISSTYLYDVFNQALADQRSPQRLVAVESSQARHTLGVQRRFGLLVLTRPQLDSLFGLHEPSGKAAPLAVDGMAYSRVFDILPTDTVLATLRAFTRLGMLRHLPAQQLRGAEARLRQFRLTGRYQVLHYLPGSVGEYLGSPAYASWSYTRLLRVLQRESDNHFAPSHLRDNCRQQAGTFSFRLGNSTYQTPLDAPSEMPDPRLFQLIQRALREQHIAGKFYRVRGDVTSSPGMAVGYLFLQPAAKRILRSRKLVPLEDPALTQQQRFAAEEAEEQTSD